MSTPPTEIARDREILERWPAEAMPIALAAPLGLVNRDPAPLTPPDITIDDQDAWDEFWGFLEEI